MARATDVAVGLRLPGELKTALQVAADASRHSLSEEIRRRLGVPFENAKELAITNELKRLGDTLEEIQNLELSVWTAAALSQFGLRYVGDLIQRSAKNVLDIFKVKGDARQAKRSLTELNTVLAEKELHLGMHIIGWRPDNIQTLASRYAERYDY